MLSVVDYGVGNIASIVNMFRYVGVQCAVASTRRDIEMASKLVLPGVGAFDSAMLRLQKSGLIDPLMDAVTNRQIPLLGVCLGMQLLTEGSEEGDLPGLGLLGGYTRRIPRTAGLRIPHMGWNEVYCRGDNPLMRSMLPQSRFYFVHSYVVVPDDPAEIFLTCNYGLDFAAGIWRNAIFGVQFHPEKSHKFGMALLRGFATL